MLEGSNMGEAEASSMLSSVTRWLQVPDYSLVASLTEKLLIKDDQKWSLLFNQ